MYTRFIFSALIICISLTQIKKCNRNIYQSNVPPQKHKYHCIVRQHSLHDLPVGEGSTMMSFAKNAFNSYLFFPLLPINSPPSAWSLLSHLSLVSGLLSCQVVPLPPLKILLVLQVLRNRLLLTPADICSMSQYQYLNIWRYLLNLVQYKYIGVQRLVSAFSPQNGRSAEAKVK